MKGNRVIKVIVLSLVFIFFVSYVQAGNSSGKRDKRFLKRIDVFNPNIFTQGDYFHKNLDPNEKLIYIYYMGFSTFFLPFDQYNKPMIVKDLVFVPKHHYDTHWPPSTHPSWNTWNKPGSHRNQGRTVVDNNNNSSYSTVDIILDHKGWVPVVGIRAIAKIFGPKNLNIGPWLMQNEWYDRFYHDAWSSVEATGMSVLTEEDPVTSKPPKQTAGFGGNIEGMAIADLLNMAGIYFDGFEEEDGERISFSYDPFDPYEYSPLDNFISASSSIMEPAMARLDNEAVFPDSLLDSLKSRYTQCRLFFDPNIVSWERYNDDELGWEILDSDNGVYYTPIPLFLNNGDGSNCGQKVLADPNTIKNSTKYRCLVTLKLKEFIDVNSLIGKKFPMEVISLRRGDVLLGEEMSYIVLTDSGSELNIDPNGVEERVQILTFKSGSIVPVDWRAPFYEEFTRGNIIDDETGEKIVYMSELIDGGFLNFNIPQEILFIMARDWLKEDGYNVLMDLRTDGVIDMLDLGRYFISGCNPFLFRRPEMFSELVSMF